MGKGAEVSQAATLTFPFTEDTGPKRLRLDFAIASDRPYQFSVYRDLHFGSEDVDSALLLLASSIKEAGKPTPKRPAGVAISACQGLCSPREL